jgi:short subunit dehydrogenase-like uncharacterized protein
MSKKPVVLYGASGFSGRLVAEFLREYNVPFIAAGRNRGKIQDVLSRVPGIENADYEIAETGGSAGELTKLFTGTKVVCNMVGPLMYYGPAVIEASLKAGCHYMDISGEQAWVRQVAEKWGPKFAEKGLLAAPATAYMSTASDIASRLCRSRRNRHAGNSLHVQGDAHVWLDANNFCGHPDGSLLSGTKSIQVMAARQRL